MQLRLRTILLCAIVFGVALRVVAVVVQAVPFSDGYHYMVMGVDLAAGKGFSQPWDCCTTGPTYGLILSHHFAPLWPTVLAAAYLIAGFSIATTMGMSLLVSILLIVVVFLTTKDLMGVDKAWIVTAAVALYYTFITLTGEAYSENLLTLFYVATIWAILRSLKDQRYVVLAGLFAGIGYLAKAGVGYFFILAGGIGFLWRFYYMRWNVLKNRYYLAAIAIFLTFVGGWALRNVLDFGWPHWETSPYDDQTVAAALAQPLRFIPVFGAKVFLFVIFFATLGVFFVPQLLKALRRWKDEDVSAHLLAIGLPAILGMIFATAYTLSPDEPYATLWWNDSLRYVLMAFVPLLWLALREEPVPLTLEPHLPSLRSFHLPSAKSTLYRLALVAIAAFAFYEVDRMIGLLVLAGALLGPSLPQLRASRSPPIRASVLVAMVLVLGLTSANAATTVVRSPGVEAGPFLARIVRKGTVIGLTADIDPYDMYPYLAGDGVTFVQWNGSANGTGAEYALTLQPGNYTGYALLATFNYTKSPGLVDSAYFWLDATVRSALGVPEPSAGVHPELQDEYFLYRAVA